MSRAVGAVLAVAALVLGAACSLPQVESGHQQDASPFRGPIVLISFSALRADAVRSEPTVTPRFDGFAAEATWSGTGVATSSWSAGSLASVLTGLPPALHGAGHPGHPWIGAGVRTLAEDLANAGFVTGAFYATPWLGPGFGLERGFGSLRPLRRRSPERWLAGIGKGPSLTWVQLPLPGVSWRSAQEEAPYLARVADADRRFGRLVDALRSAGLYDEALVIVLADHGQALGDGEPLPPGRDIGRGSVEVPLAIRLPVAFASRVQVPVASAVGLDRVYSTVLELAGLVPPPVVAPSLLRPSAWATLSELWFANGYHQIAVHEDGHQLRWRCRFAPPDPRYDAAWREALEPDGSALYGTVMQSLEGEFRTRPSCVEGEDVVLEAWPAGGGTVTVDDTTRRDRMLDRLRKLCRFPPIWSVEQPPPMPSLQRHDLRTFYGWGLPLPRQWAAGETMARQRSR